VVLGAKVGEQRRQVGGDGGLLMDTGRRGTGERDVNRR